MESFVCELATSLCSEFRMICFLSFFDLKGFEGVHKCYLDETLHTIIDRLTDAGVRHIFLSSSVFLIIWFYQLS